MKKKKIKTSPVVSGTFQLSEDLRTKDLSESKNQNKLDKEELYYARQFMED